MWPYAGIDAQCSVDLGTLQFQISSKISAQIHNKTFCESYFMMLPLHITKHWLVKLIPDNQLIISSSVSQPFLPRGTLGQLYQYFAAPLDA